MHFPYQQEVPLAIWIFVITVMIWCLDHFLLPHLMHLVQQVWNLRLQQTLEVLVSGLESTQSSIENVTSIQDQFVEYSRLKRWEGKALKAKATISAKLDTSCRSIEFYFSIFSVVLRCIGACIVALKFGTEFRIEIPYGLLGPVGLVWSNSSGIGFSGIPGIISWMLLCWKGLSATIK